MCASFITRRKSEKLLIESNTKSLGRSLAIRSKGSRVRSRQLSQFLLMEQRSKRTSSGEGQTLKKGWPKGLEKPIRTEKVKWQMRQKLFKA